MEITPHGFSYRMIFLLAVTVAAIGVPASISLADSCQKHIDANVHKVSLLQSTMAIRRAKINSEKYYDAAKVVKATNQPHVQDSSSARAVIEHLDFPGGPSIMANAVENAVENLSPGCGGHVTHLLDFSDTLEEAMRNTSSMVLSSHDYEGCISHFYHAIVNGAVPLFAKMVRPWLQRGETPPQMKVYMRDVGGTEATLAEALPTLSFEFVPWAFGRCGMEEPMFCGSPNSSIRKYAISNDYFNGEYGYASPALPITVRWPDAIANEHRKLMLDYRAYALSISPSSPKGSAMFVFLSRNGWHSEPIKKGDPAFGSEKRTTFSYESEESLIKAVSQSNLLPKNEKLKRQNLEGVPFRNQVALFRDAQMLIGLHGAGMLHCLWMPDSSTVVEIHAAPESRKLFFQWLCSEVRGLRFSRFLIDEEYNISTNDFLIQLNATMNQGKQ